MALLAFAGGVVAGSYAIDLDRIVTARFRGQLFHVPSRVFTAPTILYPGLDAELIGLRGIFSRLGFRESRGLRNLPERAEPFAKRPGVRKLASVLQRSNTGQFN